MTTPTAHAEPIDVLAVMRRFTMAHHATLGAYPTIEECDSAIDAVVELMEADKSFDYCIARLIKANNEVRASTRPGDDAFREQASAQHAYDRAAARRRAALTRTGATK